MKPYPWDNVISLTPHVFDCGYCGTRVTGQVGYRHPYDRRDSGGGAQEFIYICACGKPTYFPGEDGGHG